VNLKVFWEGEEERNSPHLDVILRQNQALLAADLWLIGDAPVHQSRRRTIYFGARGNADVEATVYGPLRAMHSGHYGNWIPNPAAMAGQLIADLRDTEGGVRIAGFDSDVRPLTPAERKAIADLPPIEDALKRELALGRSEGADGLTASTMRPALNIRRPERRRRRPRHSHRGDDLHRLPPGARPDAGGGARQVRGPTQGPGLDRGPRRPGPGHRAASPRLIRLAWGGGYPALRSDMTSPEAKAVIATASRAAGEPVAVLPMMGGSVPIYLFADMLKAR
jgi:acetylornithine deacetylase/succinyl-diaminopimelate desuccinylase-like protein